MANSSILLGLKVRVLATDVVTGKNNMAEITGVSHINDDPTAPIVFFVKGKHMNFGAGAYVGIQDIKFVENENIQKNKLCI